MSRKIRPQGRGLVLGWGPKRGEDAPFLQRLWPAVLSGVGAGKGLAVDAETLELLLAGCARDCLNTRRRRDELVSAFAPMLEASSDPPAAAASLVVASVEYHDRHLDGNGGVCKLGKFHDVLYAAASVAFEQAVSDSSAVGRLLRALHGCEGGLDRLLAPAVLGPKVSHLLSSWRGDADTAEQARRRLRFFFDHALAARLTLPGPRGALCPVVDAPLPTLQGASPLCVAVQAADEDAVLLLLQYGAAPSVGGQLCPLLQALGRLSSHARASVGQRDPCPCDRRLCPCFLRHPIDYPPEALRVLRLLLRATGPRRIPWDAEVLHPRLLCDGILGESPPSLRHWARYSLRAALLRAWRLPQGTAGLGLPEPLVRYLDLYVD